jgi:hypothetical protein
VFAAKPRSIFAFVSDAQTGFPVYNTRSGLDGRTAGYSIVAGWLFLVGLKKILLGDGLRIVYGLTSRLCRSWERVARRSFLCTFDGEEFNSGAMIAQASGEAKLSLFQERGDFLNLLHSPLQSQPQDLQNHSVIPSHSSRSAATARPSSMARRSSAEGSP